MIRSRQAYLGGQTGKFGNMTNILSQIDWTNPWSWILTGLILGITILHIIPKFYKEALATFFAIKYQAMYQQKLAYDTVTKALETNILEDLNKQITEREKAQ